MKLSRFTSSGVHGYANFDVSFDDRLTFLTGINGSGKTTVLNSIVALISPDLNALQAFKYDYIRLDLIDDAGVPNWIQASQTPDGDVQLSIGSSKDTLTYHPFISDPTLTFSRQVDAEAEHFREIMQLAAGHPVLKLIASLPTPMFLGLDRRARLAPDDRRFAAGMRIRPINLRGAFRSSFVTSLNEAGELAQDAYREARFAAGRIGEKLQQQMILSLLTFQQEDFVQISMPTAQEKKDLKKVESDLEEFPTIFRLPKADVMKRVKPFISHLQKTVKSIPSGVNYNKYFAEHGKPPPYFSDMLKWSANKSQLKKIKIISEMVAEFNERQKNALQPIHHYKELINAFLKDSGKQIDYNDQGDIEVNFSGVDECRPLSALSSGEAQIFVMITNLSFNPSAQKANVFIIDEPELSLHVRWQELFVDSMLSANEKSQFIMATHAPSIILERTKMCVDVISKKRPVKHG